jgi:hypothetical protein
MMDHGAIAASVTFPWYATLDARPREICFDLSRVASTFAELTWPYPWLLAVTASRYQNPRLARLRLSNRKNRNRDGSVMFTLSHAFCYSGY